jgi:hypothetical protein
MQVRQLFGPLAESFEEAPIREAWLIHDGREGAED